MHFNQPTGAYFNEIGHSSKDMMITVLEKVKSKNLKRAKVHGQMIKNVAYKKKLHTGISGCKQFRMF